MATPRKLLVDDEQPLAYHIVSRCVRRVRLCGKRKGRSFEHRKRWIEQRMYFLAKCFAVEVWAYAVMSNHFHIVLFYDPKACERWSDEEVAERWVRAFPPANGNAEAAKAMLLADPKLLAAHRADLGCMSKFMKYLKQPIALWVNREDGVTGHMFEQRFYSGALLDEHSVLTAMRYVDLNPHRARIAKTLEEANHTSIQDRLQAIANTPQRLKRYLAPVVGGIRSWFDSDEREPPNSGPPVQITAEDYLRLLSETMAYGVGNKRAGGETPQEQRWAQDAALLRKRQRAYGAPDVLEQWARKRKLRALERPFL